MLFHEAPSIRPWETNSRGRPPELTQHPQATVAACEAHTCCSDAAFKAATLLGDFIHGWSPRSFSEGSKLRGGLLVGLLNSSSGDTGFIMGELPTVYILMILHFEPFTFRSVKRCWPRVGWQACLCCSQVPAGTDHWRLGLCSPSVCSSEAEDCGVLCVQSDG